MLRVLKLYGLFPCLILLISFSFIAEADVFPVVFDCEERIDCNCSRPDKLDTFDVQLVLDSINTSNIIDDRFLACCYHQLGRESFSNDRYIEALEYNHLAKVLRLTNGDNLLWKTLFNIALSYEKMYQYKAAYDYYKKAFETKVHKSKQHTILILSRIGDCLSELGDIEQAIEYGQIALQKNPNDLQSNIVFADILENSKDSLRLSQAIEYADKAIQISKQINYNGELSKILSIKGNALNRLAKYDEAIKCYEDALKMIPEPNIRYQSSLLINIAAALYEKKEHHLAIENLNQSFSILADHQKTPFSILYASIYENLADNYTALKEYETALNYYQKALINRTNNFRTEDIFQNPNVQDTSLFIYAQTKFIRVLHLKANALYQYYQQNKNQKHLNLANQTYQTAFDFHDQLQKDISTENSRLFQAKNIVPYIENALKVAYQQQENGIDISKTAFRFMEKNKATVLLQSINEADALQFANLPDSLLVQEKDLKIAISFHNKQLNEAIEYEDSIEVERLEKILFEEKQQYSQLISNLESNYPDYHRLKYQQNQTQLADVQKFLDNKTALLEYFVGDSAIFILSIQREKSKLYQINKPNNWNALSTDFLSTLNAKEIINQDEYTDALFNTFTTSAAELYQLLLKEAVDDLDENITTLQIIPDAELNYMPFELWLTNSLNTSRVNYRDLPYLLKEKAISYAYSVALLLENEMEETPNFEQNYAGFAPNNKNYDYLGATKANVIKIAALLKGISLVDSEATKINFKEKIAQFKIFQLAMHGILDDANPLSSKLIFDCDSLEAYELYNMKIPAQLGVLSACETGTGKQAKGEGIMSLSRAFTYAGCQSLLMSLWSIEDQSTANIVEQFFKNLQNGTTKELALRQAKLNFLQTAAADKTHPIYWAGLIQSGDTQPIDFDLRNYAWWIIAFIFLLSGLGFWTFRKKIIT